MAVPPPNEAVARQTGGVAPGSRNVTMRYLDTHAPSVVRRATAATMTTMTAVLVLAFALAGCSDSTGPGIDPEVVGHYKLERIEPEPPPPYVPERFPSECTFSDHVGDLNILSDITGIQGYLSFLIRVTINCPDGSGGPIDVTSEIAAWTGRRDSVAVVSMSRDDSYFGRFTGVGGEKYMTMTIEARTYVWRRVGPPERVGMGTG